MLPFTGGDCPAEATRYPPCHVPGRLAAPGAVEAGSRDAHILLRCLRDLGFVVNREKNMLSRPRGDLHGTVSGLEDAHSAPLTSEKLQSLSNALLLVQDCAIQFMSWASRADGVHMWKFHLWVAACGHCPRAMAHAECCSYPEPVITGVNSSRSNAFPLGGRGLYQSGFAAASQPGVLLRHGPYSACLQDTCALPLTFVRFCSLDVSALVRCTGSFVALMWSVILPLVGGRLINLSGITRVAISHNETSSEIL